MNRLFLAGAAALALAIPAAAQDMADDMDHSEMAMAMSAQQKAMYDGWPMERRTMYDAWPANYQTYFWTLTPTQMNGWWVLTDDQRAKVYAMTPEQRTAAWTAIAAQMNGAMPSANASATATTATTAAAMASTSGPRFVSNEVVQTTPAAAARPGNGEYPPCKGDMDDHCVNPREAGLNYGNRPLNYWPGKPASEIPGKKPMASDDM